MSTDESRKTGEATDAEEGESQQDVIDRLAPSCVCPDDLCLGETGDCAVCQQIDPEWDCLQALATPDADDASTVASDPTDEWPLGDQHGYDVALCVCEGGAYLGARQMGQPCCCERCGRLTRDQWDYLVSAAATRAADDRAERIAQAIDGDPGVRLGHNVSVVCSCLRCDVAHAAARIARTTP